jgi:hypothetical protein
MSFCAGGNPAAAARFSQLGAAASPLGPREIAEPGPCSGLPQIGLTDRILRANLAKGGSAPMFSHSNKPIIFISYAHLDGPPKPRTQWLTFVMGYLRPAISMAISRCGPIAS